MIKIIIQGILVSLALSVDVFAVAIVEGLQIRSTHRTRKLLQMGSFFALTNVILLIGGYLLGAPVAAVFDRYDHWVALGLLLLVALHMLYEVVMGDRKRRKKDTNRAEQPEPRSEEAKMPAVKRIVMMALAVGIDAFAVGLSYSLSGAPIVIHSVIFFVTTLIICFIGGWLGGLVRPGFVKAAEVVGAVVLILIGINIVVEHTSPEHESGSTCTTLLISAQGQRESYIPIE